MIDQRMNIDLITQVMGVLDRHGYIRGDRQHVAHAVGTIIDLARIYEGTPDHPAGPDLTPEPPGPDGQDAVIVSAGEVKTLLAALDDDLLDLPGYLPRQGWMPATGTGTAPDICPPARPHRKSRA